MAADSSMGFYQGIIPSSFYHHHMLSFQSGPTSGDTVGMVSGDMGNFVGRSVHAGIFCDSGLMPVTSSSRWSYGHGSIGSVPKYKFVTGSPADWSLHELAILKEGLVRYAREPNILKYAKIAAMLPSRTIRDVALRCWWNSSKDCKRRKPEEFSVSKTARDMKEKPFASAEVASIQMTSCSYSMNPYSQMLQPSQNLQLPNEVNFLDNASQLLLQENNGLLSQIAANIETFKLQDNRELLLRTSSNIRTILTRMNEMPGIMSRMAPLPVSINEESLGSALQLN